MRTLPTSKTIALLGAALLLTARPARADKMEFFEVYSAYTASKGEVEVELWNEFFAKNRQSSREEHAGHQLSLEYGITDRWMVEGYAEWRDNPNNRGAEYLRTKLETRYRLGRYSPKGLNAALYGEYVKSHTPAFNDELEAKLLLSQDFGALHVSANFIVEKDLLPGKKLELGYAAGVSYPVGTTTISLEALSKPTDKQLFIMPGIHFATSKRDYVGIGVSIQASPGPVNTTLRTVFTHEF